MNVRVQGNVDGGKKLPDAANVMRILTVSVFLFCLLQLSLRTYRILTLSEM
jgi:hypothetical protein